MREEVALIQQAFRTNPNAADLIKAELVKEEAKPIFDLDYMRMRAAASLKEINERMHATRVLCVTTTTNQRTPIRCGPTMPKITRASCYESSRISQNVSILALSFIATRGLCFTRTHLNSSLEPRLGGLGDSRKGDGRKGRLHQDFGMGTRKRIPLGHTYEAERKADTLQYHPEEFVELYLGLAMEKEDVDYIVGMALAVNPNIAIFSRLLKKSLRFRKRECRRDFLRPDTAYFRGFGLTQGPLSFVFHVAGRTSPLAAKSLGRRTML